MTHANIYVTHARSKTSDEKTIKGPKGSRKDAGEILLFSRSLGWEGNEGYKKLLEKFLRKQMHTSREDLGWVLDFVFQECKANGGSVGFQRKKRYRMTLSKRP